jgi:hypothetical protein
MKIVMVPPMLTIQEGKISSCGSYAELFDPNQVQLVTIGNAHYEVSKAHSYANRNFVYDPMLGYAAWYLDNVAPNQLDYVYIYDTELEFKVWSKSEITDWLEENGTATVLIQRCNAHWALLFSDKDDLNLFRFWWLHKVKSFGMTVPFNEDDSKASSQKEVHDWCLANLADKWATSESRDGVKLYVKNEDEAVLAKLTFNAK